MTDAVSSNPNTGASPKLPSLDDLYPDRPWTRKRRARLGESPWERAGEYFLHTGLIRVCDRLM